MIYVRIGSIDQATSSQLKTLIETNDRASPTVAAHLYSLVVQGAKEDEDGQQQLRSHAEPRTTIAYSRVP
jgi:hypothetical protein